MIEDLDETLLQLMERLSYKPGWSFHVLKDPGEPTLWYLRIVSNSHEMYGREDTMGAHYMFRLPNLKTNAEWLQWVFECFVDVEVYECKEFFKVRGNRYFKESNLRFKVRYYEIAHEGKSND